MPFRDDDFFFFHVAFRECNGCGALIDIGALTRALPIQVIVNDLGGLAKFRAEHFLRLLKCAKGRVEFVQRGCACAAHDVRILIERVRRVDMNFIVGQAYAQIANNEITITVRTSFIDIVYTMVVLSEPEFVM